MTAAGETVALVRCRLIGHDSVIAAITPEIAAAIRVGAQARGLSDVTAMAILAPVARASGAYLVAPVEAGGLDLFLGDDALRGHLNNGVAIVALFSDGADYQAMVSAYRELKN